MRVRIWIVMWLVACREGCSHGACGSRYVKGWYVASESCWYVGWNMRFVVGCWLCIEVCRKVPAVAYVEVAM